jgi:hypothetical protein
MRVVCIMQSSALMLGRTAVEEHFFGKTMATLFLPESCRAKNRTLKCCFKLSLAHATPGKRVVQIFTAHLARSRATHEGSELVGHSGAAHGLEQLKLRSLAILTLLPRRGHKVLQVPVNLLAVQTILSDTDTTG